MKGADGAQCEAGGWRVWRAKCAVVGERFVRARCSETDGGRPSDEVYCGFPGAGCDENAEERSADGVCAGGETEGSGVFRKVEAMAFTSAAVVDAFTGK